MKNRSNFPRVDVDVVVSLKKQIKADVKNFTKGCIRLVTVEPVNKGKMLTLEMSLPDGNRLQIRGKVMWCLSSCAGHYEVGIDFLSPDFNRKTDFNKLYN